MAVAGLGLSNGFAIGEQESSSLLWKADVPPGFSLLADHIPGTIFFAPSALENEAVDT